MNPDLEIARAATLEPIADIAARLKKLALLDFYSQAVLMFIHEICRLPKILHL